MADDASQVLDAPVDTVDVPTDDVVAPAPKKKAKQDDMSAFLSMECQRLEAGGAEGDYTLIPAEVAAVNQFVEPTGVRTSDNTYELCLKKA